jgi:hypothetical protein
MNKKSSAITFSILILLIAMGTMLALSSFFIDQATVRPIILMRDSEVNMRCFLILLNIESNNYIRTGQNPPDESLRQRLLDTYGIGQEAAQSKEYLNIQRLGYSGVLSANDAEFRQELSQKNIECYIRSYGPVERGFVAIYSEDE